MKDSYRQAEQQLREILQAKEFHPAAARDPWWHPIRNWIRTHLHLTFTQGNWRAMVWIIGAVVVLLFVVVLIWWLVSRPKVRKLNAVRFRQPKSARESELALAESAFKDGRYPAMLHWLVETCLHLGANRAWIRYVPYKTARMYRREMADVADHQFQRVFQQVVETAEAVFFANEPLATSTAKSLLDEVRTLEQEGVE